MNIFNDSNLSNLDVALQFDPRGQLQSSKFSEVHFDSQQLRNESIEKIINSSNLQIVTQTFFNYLYHFHKSIVKKIPCGSGAFNDKVIELLHSESFNHARNLLFYSAITDIDHGNKRIC